MVAVPSAAGIAPFAIGRFTVSFAAWDLAQEHPDWRRYTGLAPRKIHDWGWGRGSQPAIDVSWYEALSYCAWLSKLTGMAYRLPTDAEWEHSCRAGTETEFWWGDEISTAQANYDGNHIFGNGKKGDDRQRTIPVDRFDPNPWGLYQVHGNIWEWCHDAYLYDWCTASDPTFRVVRGGSWACHPKSLRSGNRLGLLPGGRDNNIGFRVARTL
jgi:formylglycine-generating enzyme required for sulfatase activity